MITKYLLLLALMIFIGVTIFLFKKDTLSRNPLDLKDFQGKIVLVVNVASKCGFTNQYKDLETLYQKYKYKGLVILGIPSNDFGGQEPATATDIQSFCQLNYGVSFPMTEKVTINGNQQHELYDFLTQSNTKHKGKVKWNFTKFLLDEEGFVIDRFSPMTNPMSPKIIKRLRNLFDKVK
jgi:glutathione peroxidase